MLSCVWHFPACFLQPLIFSFFPLLTILRFARLIVACLRKAIHLWSSFYLRDFRRHIQHSRLQILFFPYPLQWEPFRFALISFHYCRQHLRIVNFLCFAEFGKLVFTTISMGILHRERKLLDLKTYWIHAWNLSQWCDLLNLTYFHYYFDRES